MNILDAIKDRNLFRPLFGSDLTSWRPWSIALRCLYGLPVKSTRGRELVQQCTGRDVTELPAEGFQTGLFLVGRRSGKSRIASLIGGYEVLFGEHERKLARGESGIIPIISPTKFQSSIVWKYLRAIFDVPLLKQEIVDVRDSDKTMVLRNGLQVVTLAGDWRTVRGPSVVCAILDEICFHGVEEESKIKSDTELVRALRPALLTTKGKLIAISSKYARKGWAFRQWRRQHGCNRDSDTFSRKWTTLVWDTDSGTMNPTLSRAEIEAAFEDDPAAARSEYGRDGVLEWRDDVSEFIPRSVVESLVTQGRKELIPRADNDYRAGADLSGGRHDSASLCIVHREGKKLVQDFIREWVTPFNPHTVVYEMARELKRFRLSNVQGDAYAGDWPREAFQTHGIRYLLAERSKSELYRELLPVLCGGKDSIELLDSETLVNQLAGLERRTRSGGGDIIDHPRGSKDDVANSLAVACDVATKKAVKIGGWDLANELNGFAGALQ